MNNHPILVWPELFDLLDRRPELRGIGITGLLEEWTA